MKHVTLITILPLSSFLFVLLAFPAMAYSIDGDISDWGVDLQKAFSGNDSGWIPYGHPNVDWIAENNIDPQYSGYKDWSGYLSTGAHMQGTGETWNNYVEPKLPYNDWWANAHGGYYVTPAGGEPFDIEALYFDDDSGYAYIAIITSMSPYGYKEPAPDNRYTAPGDIGIDFNGDGSYEYGIKTTGNNKGLIRKNTTWTAPTDFLDSTPVSFDENTGEKVGGSPVGTADVYADLSYKMITGADEIVDYDGTNKTFPNYVIEARIPRTALGNPSKGAIMNIHITIGCGNDLIEMKPIYKTNIPEFPSIALPVAAIFGVLFIFGHRNKE